LQDWCGQTAKPCGKQYANKIGNKINHKKTKTMALKLPNGQRAKTDKENMSVFCPPHIRVFNNQRIVSPEALEIIKNEKLTLNWTT
jgi:hypothetical protein